MNTFATSHTTEYIYAEPVSVCHNLAYLLPRDEARFHWKRFNIDIQPNPAVMQERRDCFGNRALFFSIQEPHRQLTVATTGEVEIVSGQSAAASVIPWETARDAVRHPRTLEELSACQFAFASPYIQWPEEIAELAKPSFAPGRPLVEAALDLAGRIHSEFTYDPKATSVNTTIADLLRHRRGVCQDLAHVQIACLRSLGLAARYVSGYLRTVPPPGRERLTGADASHAWVSFFIPGAGWLEVDPTNKVIPVGDHITIAAGRDYGDVCPLRGVILGGGNHAIKVSVDVLPMADCTD